MLIKKKNRLNLKLIKLKGLTICEHFHTETPNNNSATYGQVLNCISIW